MSLTIHELHPTLLKLEEKHGIRIIHVAECDSRAWGFSNKESDYDLRFIYVKLPWERTIFDFKEDTLRHKTHINGVPCDMQGFEISHVVRKIGQSSFAMYELIYSPIQIGVNKNFHVLFKAAVDQYLNEVSISDFCRGLMRKNFEFVKPMNSKILLHALRFGLIAESVNNYKPIELNLRTLLLNSGFKDSTESILALRDEKYFTEPPENLSTYLHRLCRSTEWREMRRVTHDDAWVADLNAVMRHIVLQVCLNFKTMNASQLEQV